MAKNSSSPSARDLNPTPQTAIALITAICAVLIAVGLILVREKAFLFENGQEIADGVSQVDTSLDHPQFIPWKRTLRNLRGFATAMAIAIDGRNRVWIADGDNHRVMAYQLTPDHRRLVSRVPVGILGKETYISLLTNEISAENTGRVTGLAYRAGHLFVADQTNNRVLVFDVADDIEPAAEYVIGQERFTVGTRSSAVNRLASPHGISISGNRLYIADSDNHRILVFDVAKIVNGEPAVDIVGYSALKGGVRLTGRGRLQFPYGTTHDGQNLWVADSLHNRIAMYEGSGPFVNRVPLYVIGPTGIPTTGSPAVTALNAPRGVAVDLAGQKVYVSDNVNRRVLGFNLPLEQDNPRAVVVLGKLDFQNFIDVATEERDFPTQRNMITPTQGALFDPVGRILYVAQNTVSAYDMNKEPSSGMLMAFNMGANTTDMSESFFDKNHSHDQKNAYSFWSPARIAWVPYWIPKPPAPATRRRAPGLTNVPEQALLRTKRPPEVDPLPSPPSTVPPLDTEGRLYVSTEDRIVIYRTTPQGGFNYDFPRYASFVWFKPTRHHSVDVFTIGERNVCVSPKESGPLGLAHDQLNHRLFVSDTACRRVLKMDLQDGDYIAATGILGHPIFTTVPSDVLASQTHLSKPMGLAYDNATQRLFITDNGHNRVVVFDGRGPIMGDAAANVLGQSSFTNETYGPLPHQMDGPRDVAIDEEFQRLFVADTDNDRVLVFDVHPERIVDGAEPIAIIGGKEGTSASTFQSPQGVAYDPATRELYVADTGNHRVLGFSVTHAGVSGSANLVLGQEDFTSITILPGELASESTLRFPTDVEIGPGNRVFVADTGNNRVVRFDGAGGAR